MKRLFIILAAVMLVMGAMAEDVTRYLQREFYGFTLGKSTRKQVVLDDRFIKPFTDCSILFVDEKDAIYTGDYVLDDVHFGTLQFMFYNDTLFYVKFFYEEHNFDVWEQVQSFINKQNQKYSNVEGLYYNGAKDGKKNITHASDNWTDMWFRATDHQLEISFTDKRLEKLHFDARLADLESSYQNAATSDSDHDPKNKVTGVAGVNFGESRQNTLAAFNKRGAYMRAEGDFVYYSNVSLGMNTFKIAKLYFRNGKFTAAEFENNFFEWRNEEAKMAYDALCASYSRKYTNAKHILDNDDAKTMFCGMLSNDYMDGSAQPICITYNLGISRGGEKFYYVTVSYYMGLMLNSELDDL